MPLEVWLGLAGTGGLLVAALAWLIYRAGKKDVQLQQEQDNARARTESDKKADDLARVPDSDLDARIDRL